MEDLNEAGGVYAVMNELSKKGLLNTDCMTVTGKTVGENIKDAVKRIRKLSVQLTIHTLRQADLLY